MDVAIAHKDYDVRGGGEKLAEALSKTFDCPLYVGIGGSENKPDTFPNEIREIETTRLIRKGIKRGGITRKIGLTLLWRQDATELYDYDTIITSGAQPRWFKPRDDQTLISYTHATPRARTDLWHTREFDSLGSRISGLISDGFELYYRPNVARPDLFVCNSDLVERRVQQYWGIPENRTTVVYPPVDTDVYSPELAENKDYYFSVSRLHPLKRYDQIIKAFQGTDKQLKIAGKGSEKGRLEDLATGHDNIEILGYISEEEKRKRLSEAKAFIFNARNEDFGIAPIEAFASGTPVIGIRDGFTQYQILNGKNGILYKQDHILEGVHIFEKQGIGWSESEIATFAKDNFSVERFEREMRTLVEMQREMNRPNPRFDTPGSGCTIGNE